MLGSTFVIGFASGNKTLPLIKQDGYAAEYYLREALVSYRVRVRHSNATRDGVTYDRHNVEIVKTTFAVGAVPEFTHTCYVVIELLPGDTFLEAADALADWLIASSNANVTKIINWES
jgi:hypothetical protein